MYPSVLIFSGKERHHCFVFTAVDYADIINLMKFPVARDRWFTLALPGISDSVAKRKKDLPSFSENINVQAIPTFQVYQKFPLVSSPNASINSSGAHPPPPGQPRGICSNVSPLGGALAILSQPGAGH